MYGRLWGELIRPDVIRTGDGDSAVLNTIHNMIAVARHSASLPVIIAAVNSCLDRITSLPVTHYAIAERIYWFVKQRVSFETDERILMDQFNFSREEAEDTELVISPEMLLSVIDPKGDCDCFATLTAAMLKCAHIRCRFVAVAVDEWEPYRFSHIFCRALINGQWLGMDTSHGSYVGWETSKPRYREAQFEV